MRRRSPRGRQGIAAAAAVLALCGCATTGTGAGSGDPGDPWEPANRTIYTFNDTLDRTVLVPVAKLYLKLPSGIRKSIYNFFDNAAYPGTVLNQFLQGKFERAVEDSARFVFNSTLGLGGLLDISTGLGLERHEEDFGQTLGVWGLGEGNFINYPFLGPSSVRDTPGLIVGALTDVLTYVALFPIGLLEVIDTRSNFVGASRLRDESAFDPYVFTREAYRQRRTFLIYDGDPPFDSFEDEDEYDEDEDDEDDEDEDDDEKTAEAQ